MEALLETCISDSSKLPHFHLKYFNWLAQVVSVRSISTYHGSGRAHVLRVWDGYQITPAHNLVGKLSSPVAEMTVAAWQWFEGVPESYFFDVLLFGEWISRAAMLKDEEWLQSGSIVVLCNLHSFVASSYKTPVLAMHEGRSYGRDIVELDLKVFGSHYRCVKLLNETNRVVLDHYKEEDSAATSSPGGDLTQAERSGGDGAESASESFNYSNASADEIPPERLAALKEAFTFPHDPSLRLSNS